MRRALLIAAVATGLLLLSLGGSASGRAATTVQVGDDFFNPTSLTIREDKTVKFEWVGTSDHNVFKKSGPGRYFDSGVTDETGFVYPREFRKPGNYVLGCVLHKDMLMDLKVKRRR